MDKKKHLIYYDNRFGRNDGPPLYYFNVMKSKLKWNVQHLIPSGDTLTQVGKADYHWWIDFGEDALMERGWQEWSIPKDGGKTIYVASDTHLDDGYRFEKAKKFDYVFFNQQHAVDEYNALMNHENKIKPHWLPHAAEPQAYPHTDQLKKYDLCFIGHMQTEHRGNGVNVTRLDALDRMFKEFPNFYLGSRTPLDPKANLFEDAAMKFNKSKVVFNISIGNDLNMRFFEVLSAGGFLLTNWIPEIENIEKRGLHDGVHFVTYKTMDEAVELTKHYLEHETERELIATRGHKAFMDGHTYQHRIEEIERIINGKV